MAVIPHFEPIATTIDGHELTLFVSGADRLTALLDLINNAKSTLRLFFYIFAGDDTARRVCDALIEARNRGVNVWLLVDGFGSSERNDAIYQPMIEAGIVFARFYPRWGRRYLLRNHQKIVIADEKRAIVGGANVSDRYYADDPTGSSWHDLFLLVEGLAARRLATYYDSLRRWMFSDAPKLRGLVRILSRRSDAAGTLRWLFNGPFRRMSPLTLAIKKDLESASQVDMIQAYFSPNWGMLRRLTRIVRRGGSVRIVSAARSDNTTTISAARHCYTRLLRHGVQVFEFTPQMLHMKLIVADDAVYIGSANFDMRSLYINGEIMLRLEDPALAGRMREFISAHEGWSDEITRAKHKARATPFARLRWLLAYFLVSGVDFSVTRRLSLRRI
jgi:cardiolipin synthase A/B